MEIFNPIFIVGAPRSGTTLLYDMMACHKDLAWFSQVDLRDVLSEEFMQFVYLRRRLFEMRRWPFSRDGFEVRVTTTFEMPHEVGLIWNKWVPKSWVKKEDVTPESYSALRKIVRDLLIKKNKNRFLNKDPGHSINIEYLNEIFPGSIFINIIRDGRATVTSMTRGSRRLNNPNGYFGLPLKNKNPLDYDLLERHARQWIEVNEEILRAKSNLENNQYFEIKYENFIAKPRETINKIFKFCNLEEFNIFDKGFKRVTDLGLIEPISDKLQSSNVKFKSELSDSEIERITKIMRDLLIRFEYA